jgi:hypothetical protein
MGEIYRHNRKQCTWMNKLASKITKTLTAQINHIQTEQQGSVKIHGEARIKLYKRT